MIGFEAAAVLWLLVPGLFVWWFFVRVQRRAVEWLEVHVSRRFRSRFSVHGRKSLRWHMALLLGLGLALIVAAAGPFSRGKTEAVSATGRLLFLVDASASMWAEDVEPTVSGAGRADDNPHRRIDVAREVAIALMERLQGFRFALASFSGTGAVHLPMTDNLPLMEDALRTLEVHSYYRNTGSSIPSALDLAAHFVDRREFRLQVVVLSDGEQPRPQDYGAALKALVEQDIRVHTVAIGSTQGQSRRILSFQDVVDKKENPRVLREYHTKRVDRHLRRISDKTGGSFFVAETGIVEKLADDVLKQGRETEPFEHDAVRHDLSGRYLLIFLAGFLFDTLWFGRRPRIGLEDFDLRRLGATKKGPSRTTRSATAGGRRAAGVGLVVAVAGLLACSLPFGAGEQGSPRKLVHRENERGIAKDALREHRAARPHYERGLGYGFEPQIPAYNLARSVLLTGDYSEAHDLFQEALLLDPGLAEAHFNDAMTLYFWGRAERDPKNCDLERTRELWIQALRRFSSALAASKAGSEGANDIGGRARDNRRALTDKLEKVEELIAHPPEECFSESPQRPSAGGGGGGAAENRQGGGAVGEDPRGGGGEDEEGAGGGTAREEVESEEDSQDQSPDGSAAGQLPQGSEDQEANGGAGRSGGSAELSEAELQQIGQQLELLAEQAREAGKYHRRTLPEQFRKADWANPDTEIWW